MLKNIEPDKLQQLLAKATQKVDPQEYSDHVTPGAGGTNPLGSLSTAGLGSIAAVLVNCLKKSAASGATGVSRATSSSNFGGGTKSCSIRRETSAG